MSRRDRAERVMAEFYRKNPDLDRHQVDYETVSSVLREAIEGFNIEPNPDRELSAENHYFIRGQLWVKDAILGLADEIEAL